MEPIPEDMEQHISRRQDFQTMRELYRSERIEKSSRRLPEEIARDMDPKLINTQDLGPPDDQSTSYQYTYESSMDGSPTGGPPSAATVGNFSAQENVQVDRQQTRLQKVTKVTKVTTTRTVEKVPIPGDYGPPPPQYDPSYANNINYDPSSSYYGPSSPSRASGTTPVPGPDGYYVTEYPDSTVSHEFVSPYAVPSPPSVPQVVQIDRTALAIVWLPPDRDGDAGPVIGYLVECRHAGDSNWYPMHDGLLHETQFTAYDLLPDSAYEFRILARNVAGFGEPSTPSAITQLRPVYGEYPGVRRHEEQAVPTAPGRPVVVDLDGASITLAWELPIDTGSGGPVAGYQVEYRPPNMDWMIANDYPIPENRFTVGGLRPNGDYEFRVKARNAEGYGEPSQSSGFLRIKPLAPPRSPKLNSRPSGVQQQASPGQAAPLGGVRVLPSGVPSQLAALPNPPSQPQVQDVDSTAVTLLWAPPPPSIHGAPGVIGYSVECREIGDPQWFAATNELINDTQLLVHGLRPNGTYEFRVTARNAHGWGEPSEVTDIVQLRPRPFLTGGPARSVPSRPEPPEIMDVSGDTVSLCWLPAHSSLPLQGYQLELRDLTTDQQWVQLNTILYSDCKMSVSNLEPDHVYEFRVIAKNAIGYSEPSLSTQPVAPFSTRNGYSEGGFPGDGQKQLISQTNGFLPQQPPNQSQAMIQRESSYDLAPLPEEIKAARESPPITDTEESPPPLRRHPPFLSGSDGVQWRDPTLEEVIDFLAHPNNTIKLNAAAYLQHLTYHDDANKQRCREHGAIPKLVDLLRSDVAEIQRNACGCLRNLSFGRQNDENKRAIRDAGGIPALVKLLRRNPEMQVKDEITGALWNLSSSDDLKRLVLEQVMEPLVEIIITPYCGASPGQVTDVGSDNPTVFRNATGVTRNVSSVGEDARKKLRELRGLLDALVQFLRKAIERQSVDNKSVENVVCILRNLSYRCQEVDDPEYDKHPPPSGHERSKSAPSGSPKARTKKEGKESSKLLGSGRKKKGAKDGLSGSTRSIPPFMEQLWSPDIVKLYLRLLQESSNPETLEAAAGAVQNLAACYWQPAIDIRATVRKEKGLPVFVELLRMEVDRVVCSVAGALRNLAMDQRNKELIGKYAMKDLIAKLPIEGQSRDSQVSDDTMSAVLGVLYQTIVGSSEFARNLLDGGGVDRLLYICRGRPGMYSAKVVKYASQVLQTMWQHKELHELYRKRDLKESDFVNKSQAARSPANTLSRPVQTQGGNTNTPRDCRRTAYDIYDNCGSRGPAPIVHRNSRSGFPGDDYSTTDGRTVQMRNMNLNAQGSNAALSKSDLYAQVQKNRVSNTSNLSNLSHSQSTLPGSQPRFLNGGGGNGVGSVTHSTTSVHQMPPAGDSWV